MSVPNVGSINNNDFSIKKSQVQIHAQDVKAQSIANTILCGHCSKEVLNNKACGGCRQVYYCDVTCQKVAWPSHKPDCLKSKALNSVKNAAQTLPQTSKEEVPNPWQALVKDLKSDKVKIRHWEADIYSPSTNDREHGLVSFSDFVSILSYSLQCQAEKLILKYIGANPEIRKSPLVIPGITFVKTIKVNIEELKKGFDQANINLPTTFIAKLEQFARYYFECNPFISFSAKSDEDLQKSLHAFKAKMDCFVFDKSEMLGFDAVKHPISITDEDLKSFDTTLAQFSININNLNCASYTLLKCGEKHAKKYIFEHDSKIMDKLLDLLHEGHYAPVKIPQNGDLVVYLNNLNSPPTHIGQCNANGKVLSKLGIMNPYVFEHQLYDISMMYGKRIIFFRKNPNASSISWKTILQDIAQERTEVRAWKALVFSPKGDEKIQGLSLFMNFACSCINLFFTKIVNKIISDKLISDKDTSDMKFLCNSLYQPLVESIEYVRNTFTLSKDINLLKSITLTTFETARKFFEEYKELCFSGKSITDMQDSVIAWRAEMTSYMFKNANHKDYNVSIQEESITEKDLQLFEQRIEKKIHRQNLSCFSYALLKSGEDHANKYVYNDQFDMENRFLDILQENNYQSVDEPGEGDLAAYFQHPNTSPTHVGICAGPGRVLSKWGNNNPYICEHPLLEVPIDYGNKVIFFRKTQI